MSGHYSTNSYSSEWKAPAWASQSDRPVSFSGGDSQLGAHLETINWVSEALVKFNKNFYKEHLEVGARSDAEVQRIRDEMCITIYGTSVPKPVLTFSESNFPDYIQNTLAEAKFAKPTPIQSQGRYYVGWPLALSGRDMIGIAQTGSGKTLAFILPAIIHINDQEKLRVSNM